MHRKDFRCIHRLRVRWAEVDMQKIVFNGHYLMYIDTAMSDYWRAVALPYEAAMQALGGEMVVKKATLEYHASARLDDALQVGLRCARVGNASCRFEAGIFNGGRLLVSGEIIYVFSDLQTQTSRPVPPALRAIFESYEAGVEMIDLQTGDWNALAACRTLDIESENGPQRGQFLPDLQAHSGTMGQEAGKKWTAAAHLQPAIPKSDRLLGRDAARLRMAVFVREQGVPAEEDADALDATARHAVAYNRLGMPVATGRLTQEAPGVGRIGRMAVDRSVRGMQWGRKILDALVDAARARGDHAVELHAQCSAEGFYRRAGFEAVGAPYDEAGIAHITMRRAL